MKFTKRGIVYESIEEEAKWIWGVWGWIAIADFLGIVWLIVYITEYVI